MPTACRTTQPAWPIRWASYPVLLCEPCLDLGWPAISMCGRIASYTPPARLARLLDARLAQGLDPVGHPSWNVTPMRRVYALTGPRASWVIDAYRWGLVPSWSQDPSVGNRLFNARAETVATTPAFRSAFANRRCLVLADGFYEWREVKASDLLDNAARKVPYGFRRADNDIMLLAGLWETWRDPNAPEDPQRMLRTCTIVTTEASPDVAPVHGRMPVILTRETAPLWLENKERDARVLPNLLRPAAEGTLLSFRVDPRVGSASNDGEHLFRPLEL